MPRPRKTVDRERERFETGATERWSAGGYGHTVKVFTKAGKLKISHQKPPSKRTKTQTLFSTDSHELRRQATAIAVEMAERLRLGRDDDAKQDARSKRLEELTVFDVCLLYMQRVPGFTPDLLEKVESEVSAWYHALPESVRNMETTPAEKTLTRDVRAFRHLFKAEYIEGGERVVPFARDRKVLEIEPADSSKLMGYEISKTRSPRTVSNEHDRLSAAFRYVVRQYRKSVGLLYNPIDGRIADRSKADVPAYKPDEIRKLTTKAREWLETGRPWQIFVAVGLSSSGRRRNSILHLSAADHDFEAGTVVWRAEFAKGGGYDRGDSLRPMTAMHRTAALWALQNRPNPNGPDSPILWMETHPDRPMNENHLDWQWKQLEKAAGVSYLKGRAIHSMRRAVVTLLADALGDGKAAEYVDMTVETVRGFSYKKVQQETMEQAARSLDGSLSDPATA